MIQKAIEDVFVLSMKEATKAGYDEAIFLSSGNVSQKELDREDNPYARRHPRPLRDPAIINAQTGQFRADWENPPPTSYGGTIEGYIENHNPIADYLTQKRGQIGAYQSFMVERPIDDEVEDFTEKALEDRIAFNLRKLETTDIYI